MSMFRSEANMTRSLVICSKFSKRMNLGAAKPFQSVKE